jgi:exopolysaccharide biosynthesis polyprenyl glycosylphosphotransferase
MLKEHSNLVQQALAAFDCALLALAFLTAYVMVSPYVPLEPILSYWATFAGFTFFYLYFAWRNSLFSVLHFGWMEGLGWRVVVIFAAALVLGAAVLFLLPDEYHGRWLYLVFAAVSFVFVGFEKLALRVIVFWVRRRGRNYTSVLLFGSGELCAAVAADLTALPQWGYRLLKHLDSSTPPEEFERVVRETDAHEVFFCASRAASRRVAPVDPYLRICEKLGKTARVFLNIGEATRTAKWEFQRYLDWPTLRAHTAQLDPDQILLKRAVDIAGGLMGVVILAIMYVPFALAIKLSSPGPVLFKQQRVGRNGRRFSIYKFRSMYLDAEGRRKELEQHNELSGPVFKMRDDPRVTPVGRFLRRFSLDEWPQFINVLRGDMSLVGTRPPTPQEVEEYERWHHRRISIKPGLTGLWQVSGRNRVKEFDDIVRLDLQYIDTWSIQLDLSIMVMTVVAVFRHDEAY